MLPRRRGFQAGNVQEKTRTHMLFSTAADRTIAKRKRRPHNKFHQMQQHKRDELVQTGPDELDPSQWTGNQRVIHFGPMAQRDPFFYFYPKGWDLLYPAQFGFFPYRTNKFRGNSAVICVWAFGIFLLLGGALMIYLGYFLVYKRPFWRWTEAELAQLIPPIQIAGPILAALGILLAIGCTISTSQFLSDKLRHHHHRDQPASVTVYTTHYQQPRAIYEVNPYQPMAPPAHTVLENPYARTNLLEPSKEMKLFPPVMPGYSTLSLHGQQSPSFVASPYNTLRALSMHSSPSAADIREPSTQSQPAPALHHHHHHQSQSHGHHHSHSHHHHRHRHSHSTHHHSSPTKRKRTSSSEFLMNGDGPSNISSSSPMDSTLPGQSEINANYNGMGEGTAGDLMEAGDGVQNQRQFSSIYVNTVEYSIPTELQYIDYLGGGNYGNVIKVRSLVDGQVLAVKKMYEPFSHEVKARRVYREMKLLELINHENIIRFADIYTPDRDFRSFKNVYIVSGYAGISLKQVLDRQKQLGIRLLNQDHIKYLIYQLLRALKYLHSANVIHRDLKPSNLAITEECDLTVLDFGLARTVSANTDNLTAYVISRWYRSPEVIYWNNVSYNAKADVWSVGCILGELLTDKVLFPGSEAMEQYKLIIRLCGSPDEELMNKIEQQNSPAMRMVIERMSGFCERRNFRRIFHQSPPDAVDLLDRLLVLDPDRRISVEEALQHAYMRDYHLPEDEPVAAQPFNIEDNDTTKTLADWREAVWHELQLHESKRFAAFIAAQNNANSNNPTTFQQPSLDLDQSTMQSSLPATTDQLPSSSNSTEISNQLVEIQEQKAEASAGDDGICANLAQEDGNLTTPQHFPPTSSTPNQSQMPSPPIVSSSSPSPKRSTEVPRSHCSSI